MVFKIGGGRNLLIARVLGNKENSASHFGFTLAEGATHADNFVNVRKFGFTLAEVLITLGIIGVVAAIVMPTLIKNYQKQQTLEGLKVAYSIFSQAVEKSKQENGDISTWEKSYSNMAPTYILPYVENIGVINKHPIKTRIGSYNYIGGSSWSKNGKMYGLKNGMTFSMIHDVSPTNNEPFITVDINGAKGPNRLSRDQFVFACSKSYNRLVPVGFGKTRKNLQTYYAGGCSATRHDYNGAYCAALIMYDGWRIADDYPW